jgi:dCTP diphosphatase
MSTNTDPPLIDVTNLADSLRRFAAERDWAQFHTPRNLLLALVGEVGELAAELQWKTDAEVADLKLNPDSAVAQELADVAIYLTRLADQLGIDLNAAVASKMASNAERYAADDVRGSAEKR